MSRCWVQNEVIKQRLYLRNEVNRSWGVTFIRCHYVFVPHLELLQCTQSGQELLWALSSAISRLMSSWLWQMDTWISLSEIFGKYSAFWILSCVWQTPIWWRYKNNRQSVRYNFRPFDPLLSELFFFVRTWEHHSIAVGLFANMLRRIQAHNGWQLAITCQWLLLCRQPQLLSAACCVVVSDWLRGVSLGKRRSLLSLPVCNHSTTVNWGEQQRYSFIEAEAKPSLGEQWRRLETSTFCEQRTNWR